MVESQQPENEMAFTEAEAEETVQPQQTTHVGVSVSTTRTKTLFDFSQHKFVVPTKNIETPAHVQVFGKSEACNDLMSFITRLQESVKSTKMSATPITNVSILILTTLRT